MSESPSGPDNADAETHWIQPMEGRGAELLQPPDSPTLITGARFGPFTLVQEIGRGGMGVVWTAEQDDPRRMVALKVLGARLQFTEDGLERWQREVRAIGGMQHEHIVRVLFSGVQQGRPFYAMELVEGQTLDAALAGGPMDCREGAQIARQVARGLAYAHKRGVIHRDIKPGNVLLSEGRARIVDFGLARHTADTELTDAGQFVGTAVYAPPEQLAGESAEQDTRADVYSLGATLYHMLTGRRAVAGDTLVEVVYQVMNTELVRPRSIRPEIPRDLENICLKMLARSPDDRYQSADEAADDLERFLDGDAVGATSPTLAYRLGKLVARHRVETALTLALVGAVVGLSGLYVSRMATEKKKLEASQKDLRKTLADLRLSVASNRAAQLRQRALVLLQQGADPARVESLLEEAGRLAEAPEAARLWAWLALERGQLTRARALIDKALGLASDDYLTRYLAYRWHQEQGTASSPEAERHLHALERFGANTAIGWWSKGRRLWRGYDELGKRAKRTRALAILAHANRAVSADPRFNLAYLLRGHARLELGQLVRAREDLERLIQLSPASKVARARGHYYIGKCDLAEHRYEEAVPAFGKAIALLPVFKEAWFDRGWAYRKLGRHAHAKRDYDRGIGLAPKWSKGYVMRGLLRRSQGKDATALKDFDHAIRLDPRNGPAYTNRANLHADAKRYKQALADYAGAIRFKAQDPQVYLNRAILYQRLRRLPSALRDVRAALRTDPTYARAHYDHGVVLTQMGKHAEAIDAYSEAIRLSPGHLQARNNRALAYERRGDAARALADYTAALKLKPTFLPALVNRGALHGRKQRYRQAIADFERALPLARGTRWEAEARKMLAFWRKKLR